MGNFYHDIELFTKRVAPKHTALNRRELFKPLPNTHLKKSFLNRDRPPPKRGRFLELLNVFYRTMDLDCDCSDWDSGLLNKKLFVRCRAPPCQEF